VHALERPDGRTDVLGATTVTDALLDVIPLSACLLDAQGTIVSVNRAWQALTAENASLREFVPKGCNFPAACERSTSLGGSSALAKGMRQLLLGRRERFTLRFSWSSLTGRRWLEMRAARLASHSDGCTVTCEDITKRRRAARSLQRFRAADGSRRRQAVQHALLAQFGQFALENPPIDELITQAVEIVRSGLGVSLCRLLRTGPDEQTLIHAAGCGWDEAWVLAQRFDVVVETEDRFILGARESIVVADFSCERRFRPSPIQVVHGVRSAVEVLICGSAGTYGVIGAYAQEPGRFDAASANFLQSVSNTLAAFIERKATDDRLSYMAQFDSLTGLPNRSMYLDRLGHTLIEAARDKLPVAVLFVDIDRFKVINDTLGHSAGDALLVKIAERLLASVRLGDTIGRLSGDEFAIALAHLAQEDHAGLVVQKIVREMAEPFVIDGRSIYVSASVGVSMYPSDGTEPDLLLKNADTAMYRAKQSGRNAYQFYLPEMQIRATERLRLETQLRGALDRGEYLLYYQPKVDLTTGSICGIEALLRWRSADRGVVAPGEFISVLEDAGLIVPVGEWVIASVCTQIREWQDAGIDVHPVAVNLSARQFRQQDLDTVIGQIVVDSGIDPSLLEFELTETILMSDAESAVETLRRIKARGMRLALDDFGTGYSSLSYLKRFPLDTLKIDRSFIRDVTSNPDDASIVLAIINLARGLKMRVVAEGVETAAQISLLHGQGCDEVQGYYIARPMPAAAMTQVLREGLEWRFSGDVAAGELDRTASRLLRTEWRNNRAQQSP
jgi:diguanylate cyclase (GGDEF)-like protein